MKSVNTIEILGLRSQLEIVQTYPFQWVSFVNVLALSFGLFLLSSKWLCPPGVQLNLPKLSTTFAYQTAMPLEDVLLVDAAFHIFFHHKMYDFSQLKQIFHPMPQGHINLLLKMDRAIPLEKVLQLVEAAKVHGYQSIQIAVGNYEDF